jgi:uncharacterized membrane protein
MSKLWSSVLDFLWEAGHHACHQMPERSFFYKGEQLPVCARCTGTALGQLLFLLFASRRGIKNIVCMLLLLPLGIDWSIQFVGIRESTNRRRLVTGLLGGFAVFGLYRNLIVFFLKRFRQFCR